jgi:hypothetical protein
MEYNSEEDYEKYALTDDQIKACKKVFAAMRAAGKLGVQFWDMYGTLTAYNGNVFSRLHMHPEPNSIEVTDNCEATELIYYEHLDNFSAGCADDRIWLELK